MSSLACPIHSVRVNDLRVFAFNNTLAPFDLIFEENCFDFDLD